jgi:hypothetical protein
MKKLLVTTLFCLLPAISFAQAQQPKAYPVVVKLLSSKDNQVITTTYGKLSEINSAGKTYYGLEASFSYCTSYPSIIYGTFNAQQQCNSLNVSTNGIQITTIRNIPNVQPSEKGYYSIGTPIVNNKLENHSLSNWNDRLNITNNSGTVIEYIKIELPK